MLDSVGGVCVAGVAVREVVGWSTVAWKNKISRIVWCEGGGVGVLK